MTDVKFSLDRPPFARQGVKLGTFPHSMIWSDSGFPQNKPMEARPDRGGKLRTRKLRMQRKVKRHQEAPTPTRIKI